jgi:hypothetical protein
LEKTAARRVRQGIGAVLDELFPADHQGFGQEQGRVQAGTFDAAGFQEGGAPGKGFRDSHDPGRG